MFIHLRIRPVARVVVILACGSCLTLDRNAMNDGEEQKKNPPFNASSVKKRLNSFWSTGTSHRQFYGYEHHAFRIYLDEIISDRYLLIKGHQLIRDELQLSFKYTGNEILDRSLCSADVTLPSVITTLAHTNCGDRIHQGDATTSYVQAVASRLATLSEIGEFKLEAFFPTGGGTDDGHTLANVTLDHALDASLKEALWRGNPNSFMLACIDLKTHVGRLELKKGQHIEIMEKMYHGPITVFGKAQESEWREARNTCGAIGGCLAHFDESNPVHRRLRRDLGEENFKFLRNVGVTTDEGVPVTAVVAAAIVAIQGMVHTLEALGKAADERTVGTCTASVTINRVGQNDTLIYAARGTVFQNEVKIQGLGLDASKYQAHMENRKGDTRLILTYGEKDQLLPVHEFLLQKPMKF